MISVVLFLFIVMNCTNTKSISGEIDKVCINKLGKPYRSETSPGNSFLLCTKEVEIENRRIPELKYLVFDKKTGKIIYDGKVLAGTIKWISEKELLIHEKIAILGQKNKNERTYKVNVLNGDITQIDRDKKTKL